MSESGARRAARPRIGRQVGHAQFVGYRRWGLIPDAVDGRYPEQVIERLIRTQAEIRTPYGKTRSMPRRVIRLWTDVQTFSVEPPAVRRAMKKLLGPRSIDRPSQKFKWIYSFYRRHRRWGAVRRRGRPQLPFGLANPLLSGPLVVLSPTVPEWHRVIDDDSITDAEFGRLAEAARDRDKAYGYQGMQLGWPQEEEIPLEERLTLLTAIAAKGLIDAKGSGQSPDIAEVSGDGT